MSTLVYLFLLLLLNKCSCPIINYSSSDYFLIAFSGDKNGPEHDEPDFDSTNRIIIFSAVLMLLALLGIFLCKLCSRNYRSSSEFLAREPSLTSLDRLVRDRMQDCPPTYVESQRNLPPEPSPDPPPYNDEAKTCSRCAIFTITKNGEVQETDLCSLDDQSVRSAPPDYALTEGVINPAFVALHASELSSHEALTANNQLVAENHM